MARKPTAPEIPADLPEEDRQKYLLHHAQAYVLAHQSAAIYVSSSAYGTIRKSYSPQIFTIYLAKLLEDCGDPEDPIARMLIEQLALAHHIIGRLYIRAAESQDAQRAAVYDKAAARLLGELRRLALALKEYRTPPSARPQLVIRQQNVAGSQQIAYVDPSKNDLGRELEKDRDTEPVGKQTEELTFEHPVLVTAQPEPGSSGETQQAETGPSDARGPRKASRRRAKKQAVGTLHRSQDG